MKVQCEQCGAAYSVADEKVAGRKLRQRCRKCGEPIIIDGTALDGAPQEESFAVSVPADSEAVWHIAVGDTTQGPYTLQELAQYYADGHIVLDTLVCRDGWNDWKQAGEVPELVSASRDSAQPLARSSRGPLVPQHVAAFGDGAGAAHAASLEKPVTMGSDPFGEAPIAPSSPRVTMEEMATPGMQRDGTVQFSMDEIRALSAVSMPPVQPVSSSTLPGHATHDDSGLIDMRALAAAEAEAAAAAAQHGGNGFRPITPSQVSPLQAVSPLSFAQSARPVSPGLDTRTKVFAGLAAFGFVLAAVVAVIALQRTAAPMPIAVAAPVQAAAIAQPPAPAEAQAAAPAAETAAAEPAAAPQADEPAAKPEQAEVAAAEPRRTKKGSSRSNDGEGATASRGAKHKAHAAAEEKEDSKAAAPSTKDDDLSIDSIIAKKPAPKKGSQSIDDLLDGAVSGAKKPAAKEEAAPEASGLPQTPSREQMMSALGSAKSKASKCKGPGVATATITISGKSGRASSVDVSGVEGAAKSCVEKAVRSTSFPKFQKENFEVKFPFKLGA